MITVQYRNQLHPHTNGTYVITGSVGKDWQRLEHVDTGRVIVVPKGWYHLITLKSNGE